MIGGASVDDTLTLCDSSLRDAKQRIRPLFAQERGAALAGQFSMDCWAMSVSLR